MAKLLNFLGITYLVGESKVQNLNFRVHWLSEIYKVYLCSHFASTFSRTRFTEMALVDLNPLCCLSVVDHLPWEDIGSVSSASMLWRKTAQSWICSPHIPRSMRFLAPGSTWSFSCELSCEDTDPGKTQDVIFRFMGLSAREAPRLRWLFHAGGQNFDEEDDDRNWGFDDEWPDATGMYLAGYTNRPDFFKKLKLPETIDVAQPHKVEVRFHELHEGHSGEDIEVFLDNVQLDTGPGLGMKGRGKGHIHVGQVRDQTVKQVEICVLETGSFRIWNEAHHSTDEGYSYDANSSQLGWGLKSWFASSLAWPRPAGVCLSRWWFQIFFIFTLIWGRFPFWLIFFKGVETTN